MESGPVFVVKHHGSVRFSTFFELLCSSVAWLGSDGRSTGGVGCGSAAGNSHPQPTRFEDGRVGHPYALVPPGVVGSCEALRPVATASWPWRLWGRGCLRGLVLAWDVKSPESRSPDVPDRDVRDATSAPRTRFRTGRPESAKDGRPGWSVNGDGFLHVMTGSSTGPGLCRDSQRAKTGPVSR